MFFEKMTFLFQFIVINVNIKYTKQMLEPIVESSYSILEVIRKLNMKFSGGLHGHLSFKIKEFKINIDHFKGRDWNKGKSACNKKSWSEVLVKRDFGSKEQVKRLRDALIESGIEYKCKNCGISPLWNNCPLVIQINHIDGNWLNNLRTNLRFLCPNCHSQTNTFGTKNLKNAIVT